jgi:hypothetical protein
MSVPKKYDKRKINKYKNRDELPFCSVYLKPLLIESKNALQII